MFHVVYREDLQRWTVSQQLWVGNLVIRSYDTFRLARTLVSLLNGDKEADLRAWSEALRIV